MYGISVRLLLGVLLLLVIVAIATLFAWQRRAEPMLFELNPDPEMVRPRTLVLPNPFRERAAERVAEQFLIDLRDGHVELIAALPVNHQDQIERRRHIVEMEKRYPIRSWRLSSRSGSGEFTYITYWVRRRNGYKSEEEVLLLLQRSGERWIVVGFDSIH